MAQAEFSLPAEKDLTAILLYIAKHDPQAGVKLLDKIESRCQLLADNPYLGRARPDLGERLRSFPVRHYLIVYRVADNGIEVARVVRGERDLVSLFG